MEDVVAWLLGTLAEYAVAKLLDALVARLRERKAPKAGKHFRGQ